MSETITISATYTWCQFCPAFALVILAGLILLADTFLPKLPKRSYALIGALGCLICAVYTAQEPHWDIFGFLASIATALSLLLAFDYKKITCESIAGKSNEEGTAEFYALPLVACAGVLCLSQARDLILLFVSLEVITLTSYVLAGYFRRNRGSIEAGIKYLILGAMSTGLLVYGAAWYFGMSGSFCLSSDVVLNAINGGQAGSVDIAKGFLMATALLFTGAFFKIGAAPMHIWIPDVYQGAPTPVTTFLAVASKTAGFALLTVLVTPFVPFIVPGVPAAEAYIIAFSVVAAATLLIGNLGAIPQSNAKRLLGYSSIGQAGFILIFFLNPSGATVVLVCKYLLAYLLATVAAFYAIALVRTQRGSEEISAFRGLGKTNPRAAFLITVAFASLAGVPLTYGFLVKMLSFICLVDAIPTWGTITWLLPVMIVSAAAGFYYYFKVLRAMYWEKPLESDKPLCLPVCTAAVLTVCAIAIIYLGTYPLLVEFPH